MTAISPIAIVGIGCRLPGGIVDAESFWALLIEGRSGIGEVPADRWNLARYYHADAAVPGTMATKWGGFVTGIDRFDAQFWGVSPREASRMDPQQRWLLEVAWESIEDAGTAPRVLRGRDIGVFIGVSGTDYGGLQLGSADAVDAYTNSGSTSSIASNRVSYMLDLRGPSVSVDTACSSSLVAVAMACESIWSGRSEAALAGGVNALIAPQTSIGFSKAGMLSPTGQCFAFDARANGYVRAEGAAVVYLKPLDRARADGDRVYAVIRAAVVNQDGHTSSMTVPSADAQAAMLRAAYAQAHVAPARVAYVEAHGTGTPVGDPIEAAALGRVLGDGRSRSRALIGSVKTNIGHLETASGIAGLIKAALVAYHRTIPPTLNHERPNASIPFGDLRLEVVTRERRLPANGNEPPIVGVNSFGFGGTNAHVVLEAPADAGGAARDESELADRPCLLPMSARGESALRAYAEEYRALLAETQHDLREICASAGARKEHHDYRLVFVGRTPEQLRNHLAAWLRDGRAAGVVAGRPSSCAAPVFVFTGQGPQWWGMGRQLLEREPSFRRTLQSIDARIRPLTGWSLIDEMTCREAQSRIDRTDVAQPAIFALQLALADLWKAWGIEPAAVVGHSVGEVAAACCAGIYSLDDAVTLIVHRSRLQHTTAGTGRMLAVALPVREARELVCEEHARVELAAVNSPRMVTLSGAAEDLRALEQRLTTRGVFTRWVRSNYAFHSAQMNPIREQVLEALAAIQPRASRVPFFSTVTGGLHRGDTLDAAYWWDNIRQPVLFGPAIDRLIDADHERFLELGPHPALASSVREALDARGRAGTVLHSLRRNGDESREMLGTLAALHVAGVDVDWRAVNQSSGSVLRLPHYPWQRERFWAETAASARTRLEPFDHPLLGVRLTCALPTWHLQLDLRRLAYLREHRIWDRAVVPAAAYGEIGLAVARQLFADEPHAVEQLAIKKALVIDEQNPPTLQTTFTADGKRFAIYSGAGAGHAWELHAEGTLVRMARGDATPVDLAELRSRLPDQYGHTRYRHEFEVRGYQFGPAFQQVQTVCRSGDEALIEIDAPQGVADHLPDYCFHPALQDACFHAFIGLPIAGSDGGADRGLLLPSSIRRIALYRDRPPARLCAHARMASDDGHTVTCDIAAYDTEGRRVADFLGFRLDRVDERQSRDQTDDCYYRFAWLPKRLRGSGARGTCGFPPLAPLVEAVTAVLPGIRERHALAEFEQRYAPRAEAAAIELALNGFLEMGWAYAPGDEFDLDGVVNGLHIADGYRRVTHRLLMNLEAAGWLQSSPAGTWTVRRAPQPTDVTKTLDALAADFPQAASEIDLFRCTGLRLAGILCGDIDPLDLLFPGGSTAIMERFYGESLAFPAYLELMRTAIARLVAALPHGRTLRVLEVGGGTGVLTRAVLPVLPHDRTDYTFTDVSTGFVSAARKRFADYPFIDYQLLDLDCDLQEQGLRARQFDLILAGDALHATRDLRVTLSHLERCLAADGVLMFLELVKPGLVRDNVTYGLLAGYSAFEDTSLRHASPLVDSCAWTSLLDECGFRDAAAVTCSEAGSDAEHALVIASAPAAAAAPMSHPGKQFVIVADAGGVASSLRDALQQAGHDALIVDGPVPGDLPGILRGGSEPTGVIHCRSLDRGPGGAMTADDLRGQQQADVTSAFRLIRALADTTVPAWFVTRNAHRVVDGDMVDGLATAPVIGLTRVANNELQCRFVVVDLDGSAPAEAAEQLLAEITLPRDGEFEIAYRHGARYAMRLRRQHRDDLPPRQVNARRPDGSVTPFRLQTGAPGILSELALYETGRRAPGPGEIEVRVRAVGINFRDVMKALGTHPGQPIDRLWFGDDFSGTVERIGAHVEGVAPGDAVVGLAPYACSSHVTTNAHMVVAKPADLSFEDAAALPTAFLTAHYAINELARMQPGESILIHAGTGGVGQAAIQIASRLGLEIFATGGSPEKRQLLRDQNVPHVMSSRTLDFADEIMTITNGRGVDAVLNSLAGDFIPKSLSVLAPFGRFLEIGKVDVYRNAQIGLHALKNNVSCFVIDLTQHWRQKPALIRQMLAEIVRGVEAKAYRPLPRTTFPVTEAAAAFRHMTQGKHVGKNVLTFDADEIPIRFTSETSHRFTAGGTYLITGGAGGFGLEVAKWIARHGGRHLVLMSRSGPRDADAQRQIDQLHAEGVQIWDARADVSDADEVHRVIEQIRIQGPPLRGVFHAAMVLDDDLLTELTEERIERVLAPKAFGAWNLHRETEALPLDHFVCFSSFSAVIAMLRQGNYNAGNVFLDALAHYRHARGLPALTVNWGALRGAGFVERDRKTSDALDRLGFGAFQVDEALRVLERMLVLEPVQLAAGRVNWTALAKLSPLVAASRTYADVTCERADDSSSAPLVARLRAAHGDERTRLLEAFIATQAAAVFGASETKIDRSAPLSTLGLDSLTGLELTNRLERELGVRIPMGSLLGGPSVTQLAQALDRLLDPASSNAANVNAGTALDHVITIRAGGTEPPLFCVHPVGGGVGVYAGLAAHIPEGMAIYGIESRLLRGQTTEYSDLDTMVQAYADAICVVHDGPYRLLGFSLGGYLAGRIAEHLERRGKDVDLVGVLDWDARQKPNPDAQRDALVRLSLARYRFLEGMDILRPRPEPRLRAEITALVDRVYAEREGALFFEWAVQHKLLTSPGYDDVARESLTRFEQHCRLLSGELPQPRFRAPLIVWRASDGFGSPLASWNHGGSIATEHVIEGDHNALIGAEAIDVIGPQLREFLVACEAAALMPGAKVEG